MRCYKFSAADRKLVMADTELAEPTPGQVRVRVAAASLNYRDLYMISRFGDVGIDNRIPWHALFVRAPLERDDRVLIQGTGGVALFALQFAHAAGVRFNEALQAFAHMAEQRHFGKLVINVAGG